MKEPEIKICPHCDGEYLESELNKGMCKHCKLRLDKSRKIGDN
jgi:hypothetical protein